VCVGLALVLGVGGLVYWQVQATEKTVKDLATDARSGESVNESVGMTTEALAAHTSRESCWTAINGSVYDLTSWIPKHPGGEQAILQLCGTDGSEKFNRQHGGDSAKEALLAGFKIGVLVK
jgi:cytochrome b involved in lipid metabolism